MYCCSVKLQTKVRETSFETLICIVVQAIEVRQRYMKVSHQQFPSFGNRFLAAYRGEVYQKPRGLPVKASLEGNFRNKYLSRNDFFHLNFKKKSIYLSSSVLFPGSEEGIQTKTKYLKATFYISFALYLDIFTQRFILCLVLFCLMLNEDLYFVALKIYFLHSLVP